MSVVHVVHKITIQKMKSQWNIKSIKEHDWHMHRDGYCVQSQVGLFSRQNTDIKVITDETKRNPPYAVSKNMHFLAALTKSDTFYFQRFWPKKGKSADWKKIFIYENNMGNRYFNPRCLEKKKIVISSLSPTHNIVVYVISKSDMKKINKLFNKN